MDKDLRTGLICAFIVAVILAVIGWWLFTPSNAHAAETAEVVVTIKCGQANTSCAVLVQDLRHFTQGRLVQIVAQNSTELPAVQVRLQNGGYTWESDVLRIQIIKAKIRRALQIMEERKKAKSTSAPSRPAMVSTGGIFSLFFLPVHPQLPSRRF